MKWFLFSVHPPYRREPLLFAIESDTKEMAVRILSKHSRQGAAYDHSWQCESDDDPRVNRADVMIGRFFVLI